MKTPSQRESAIFSAARRLPASQHGAYLDESCAGDALLRQRVAELLQANEAAGTFLKELALHPGEEDAPSHLAKLGDRIGRYKLLEIVGEGGCGVVYMAEQEEPVRRRVALKVIKLGMDTRQVIARFEAERQALALMDHFNIAKVLDGGSTETGRPFFVMELVKGIPITRYCDEHNLNMAKRLALFVQVCQAIQHAHQKGIIHRDIKPSNVLVADHDGVPVPKIIDFGIAKATTDQRLTDKTLFTAFDQFIGTPAYMSPEQANFSGLDIDTRSDIYSLGVLLYELLIGKTPFEAEQLLKAGLDEIRRVIREEEPARPSTKLHTLETAEQTTVAKHRQSDPPKLAHLISGDLDWIVMKCLEKDRKRRYETASGLAADLLRHLNNEPVVARPAGGFYRFQRMVRRNKLVFAAAGAVALALIAGLGLSTWAFLRERQARNNEHQAEDNQQRLLYVADMNLARPAWDQNNLGQLNQLLEDTRAFPDRGFEWYYWQRKVHPCLMTLHPWGRSSNVNFVTFSPDGRRIVTGGSPSKVWDAASGRELLTLTDGFMAFSPDGQRMVTCGGDHTAKVLDTVSGRELLTLKGHLEGVKSVAFSPNGQRIVTGSDDGTAKEWDAASGRELLTLDDVLCVAISPDGRRIVTGSNDGTTKEWDAASGREVVTINGHDGRVRSVAFSPDGQRILTSSSQEPSPDHHLNQLRHSTNAIRVLEAESGREVCAIHIHVINGFLYPVSFSPDGRRIVTGGSPARVWDAASGRELFDLLWRDSSGVLELVSFMAFSPDGKRIVTGNGYDRMAKVWDMANGQELLTIKGHNGEILSVAFSPDGQRIVTGSNDGTAKVWDAAGGQEPLTFKQDWIESAAFSPDSQRILSVGTEEVWMNPAGGFERKNGQHGSFTFLEKAKLWDAASGRELLTFGDPEANGKPPVPQVTCAAFSQDGHRIATGIQDGTTKLWDAASGRELLTLRDKRNDYSPRFVAFSPDSKRLLIGHGGDEAELWETASGREIGSREFHTLWRSSEADISFAAFSPDGRRILTGGGKTAKLWEATNGHELLTLSGHTGAVSSVAFSPNGQWVVTGSEDRTAKVWDAVSGRELLTLKGHNDKVRSVAISPDGRRIVTGSNDHTAKLWDAVSGRELLTIEGHTKGIICVAFSPDGQRLVTVSDDVTAKVWQAARPEQIAQWQEEEAAPAQH